MQEARGPETEKNVVCSECRKCFRRECDKGRHKCTPERDKPVSELMVVYNARDAEGGLRAEEVWQCTSAGDKRNLNSRLMAQANK